jgi:hypothetical protein
MYNYYTSIASKNKTLTQVPVVQIDCKTVSLLWSTATEEQDVQKHGRVQSPCELFLYI